MAVLLIKRLTKRDFCVINSVHSSFGNITKPACQATLEVSHESTVRASGSLVRDGWSDRSRAINLQERMGEHLEGGRRDADHIALVGDGEQPISRPVGLRSRTSYRFDRDLRGRDRRHMGNQARRQRLAPSNRCSRWGARASSDDVGTAFQRWHRPYQHQSNLA